MQRETEPNEQQSCFITDMCISCGRCAEVCPAHCIVSGFPRKIDQSRCLRCGACVKACPWEAIERRESS